MAFNNFRVSSFVSGATTFNAEASGVYVLEGSAVTQEILERVIVLPYGGVHDLDGSDDGVVYPGKLTQRFFFAGVSPIAHAEYSSLLALMNKSGTLTLKIPASSSTNTYTVTARLLRPEGDWRPPYRQGARNHLYITATWQLKGTPALV
jgi:hypothetical protein